MATPQKRLSCNESKREWKRLFRVARDNRDRRKDGSFDDGGEDPFECDSVARPPLYIAADGLLGNFVQKWKHIDNRRFSSTEATQIGDPDANANGKKIRKRLRYAERSVCLPEKFDYKTERTEPPPDDRKGDRLISMQDPTKTLSYHQELWKLFASVPKFEALRDQYYKDTKLMHTKAVYEEIISSHQSYMRADAHALGRLRLANQHAFPTTVPPVLTESETSSPPVVSTIRFECFRRQPKRGPQPDQCRLVLEFLSSQTLLDVHRSLVELTDDELWEHLVKDKAMVEDGEGNNYTSESSTERSGIFLIEDGLYTTGNVDYYGPIKEWLDSNSPPNDARRKYLGINRESPLNKVDMAKVTLAKLSVRLATRYCHICHGDVETAIFVTDRRVTRKERVPYPIIHDRWMHMANAPICDCCQRLQGVFVTNTTCSKTDGQKYLCEECCQQLSLSDEEVQSFHTWKFQPDLSASATQELVL